ncbi:uncharacterized protein LOC119176453 isoform X1 [Rhipicephalus microplus]|uniref:uncharacterized protein LOC119176453 isoform X1 n=1 Tax=Rhipicephalus microplus TaxID=6941 RepID=UPI002F2AFF6D
MSLSFLIGHWLPSTRANVAFSMIHSRCRISLDNAPFRVLKETVKVCIFGTEYYKKTPEKRQKGSGLECHWLAEGGIQDSNATVWPKDEHKKKK